MRKSVDRVTRIILLFVSAAVIFSAAASQLQTPLIPPPARAVAFAR